jgi:hypothetical protein
MKRKGYPTRRRRHRIRRQYPRQQFESGFGLGLVTGLMIGTGFGGLLESIANIRPGGPKRKGKVLKFPNPLDCVFGRSNAPKTDEHGRQTPDGA